MIIFRVNNLCANVYYKKEITKERKVCKRILCQNQEPCESFCDSAAAMNPQSVTGASRTNETCS